MNDKRMESIDRGLDNFQPACFRLFMIISMIPFVSIITWLDIREKRKLAGGEW